LHSRHEWRIIPQIMMVRTILDKHLKPRNKFIYGFADLTGLLLPKFGNHTYGISIAKKLSDRIVDGIKDSPTLEYYHHYRQVNDDLFNITLNITNELNLAGIPALNIVPTISTSEMDSVYLESLRTDLSHKMVATQAGLGWIGKTALFISKKFGPRLRLVTILTSFPLKPESDPITKSRCGSCTLCVNACPAIAANGKLWNSSVDRDEFFDASKCRNQCKIFGQQLQMDIRICGICIAVCPIAGQNATL